MKFAIDFLVDEAFIHSVELVPEPIEQQFIDNSPIFQEDLLYLCHAGLIIIGDPLLELLPLILLLIIAILQPADIFVQEGAGFLLALIVDHHAVIVNYH
jgi:hypothetical protein